MTANQPDREVRFRQLFDSSYADVLRFVQRRTDPSHAEDVAAEAFLVVWRRLDDAPKRSNDFRAWLFGIARNIQFNAERGRNRHDALAVRLAETAGLAAQGTEPDLVARQIDLAAAWQRLSATDQEALALTVLDDLTSPQAARVLGISAPAYRLRLLRARRALRDQLGEPAHVPLASAEMPS